MAVRDALTIGQIIKSDMVCPESISNITTPFATPIKAFRILKRY
jgi:hypothetical protein